jgi:hypothetical protein
MFLLVTVDDGPAGATVSCVADGPAHRSELGIVISVLNTMGNGVHGIVGSELTNPSFPATLLP